MEILKDAGEFEVVDVTQNHIEKIAQMARICYQSEEDQKRTDEQVVKGLITKGHFAMIEFGGMSVIFNMICRGFTHEDVRHRLCSFAQESTRYVDESDLKVVAPPHKNENEKLESFGIGSISLREWFEYNEKMYHTLIRAGWKTEDARQILPIATKAQIGHKANFTEWRHIFDMRCDKYAHWEIRRVMLMLLHWCKENIEIIFNDYFFFNEGEPDEYASRILPRAKLRRHVKEYLIANESILGIMPHTNEIKHYSKTIKQNNS